MKPISASCEQQEITAVLSWFWSLWSPPLIFLCSQLCIDTIWQEQRERQRSEGKEEGEGNQGVLCCLINYANQWWGVRSPLTCSETPQSAMLLKAWTQWSKSHRWGVLKNWRQTQEWNTCADDRAESADKIWIQLSSCASHSYPILPKANPSL